MCFMQNVFINYPEIPWKQSWEFFSGPENQTPFITTDNCGTITVSGTDWALQLISPEAPCTTRLFANGLSISARKHPDQNYIHALLIAPGTFCGTVSGLPRPRLSTTAELVEKEGFSWTQTGHHTALLLCKENRFALIYGELTPERAMDRAETVLDENFDQLTQTETEDRKKVAALFSINPRHNPPVALAAEILTARLRQRTGTLHGLWSRAEGFENETFSLNELYPLIRAWCIIDPPTALELAQTALSLQQNSGGFPSWIEAGGLSSTSAPWPFIVQAFELAWRQNGDSALLKKHLPALRKYMQWAMRRFDPHRDRIPAWQNEQEIFIPEHFERGKATPELTVMLITELDALIRLCEVCEYAEASVQSLAEERDQLTQTLNTVFWNPEQKAFSNVWKNGHYLHEPSFGSFMPLFWRGLDREKQTALLEAFEETHGFPGQADPASWKQERIDDAAHLPAIHQFIAFEALRNAGGTRAPLMLFVRRAREGFAAWFERESIEAARHQTAPSTTAYALGPVTAALILAVQEAFENEASKAPSAAQLLLKWGHRRRINKTDLRIVFTFLLAIVIVHLAYTLPRSRNSEARVAEAALSYQQGHYTDAMRICRHYPNNALSRLIQANLLMLAERPDQAETLYRKALLQETESPSALFGLALALQLTGNLEEAQKRYIDFIDIHENRYPAAAQLADEFMQLARDQFTKPPRWRRAYALPMMNDLGL